jgi:hypothetical protein
MKLASCDPSGGVYSFVMASRFVENFCTPALGSLGLLGRYLCDVISQSLHAVIFLESKFIWMYG